MPPEPTGSSGIVPETVTITETDVGVVVHVHAPINVHACQHHLFRAMCAGCEAAGISPMEWVQRVVGSGDLVAEISGSFLPWVKDILMHEGRFTVARVVAAALESYGYKVTTAP